MWNQWKHFSECFEKERVSQKCFEHCRPIVFFASHRPLFDQLRAQIKSVHTKGIVTFLESDVPEPSHSLYTNDRRTFWRFVSSEVQQSISLNVVFQSRFTIGKDSAVRFMQCYSNKWRTLRAAGHHFLFFPYLSLELLRRKKVETNHVRHNGFCILTYEVWHHWKTVCFLKSARM